MADAALAAAARVTERLSDAGLVPDEHHVREIPLNDEPRRVAVTRASTTTGLQQRYGVAVVTRGRFYPRGEPRPPSDAEVPIDQRPLYLLVSSKSQSDLDAAARDISAMLAGQPPAWAEGGGDGDGPSQHAAPHGERRGSRAGLGYGGGGGGGRGGDSIIEKVYVDVPIEDSRFSLRGKIIGPRGAYIKHISQESGCRVHLRGRGSSNTGEDARDPEPLHLWIEGHRPDRIEIARILGENLLLFVATDYRRWKEQARSRYTPSMTPMMQQHVPGQPGPSLMGMAPMQQQHQGYQQQQQPQHGYQQQQQQPPQQQDAFQPPLPPEDPPPLEPPGPMPPQGTTPEEQEVYRKWYAHYMAYYYPNGVPDDADQRDGKRQRTN